MKISASLIVRDDESTLEACLKSIRPHVDEIVVVDTGSTDKSPEIAQKYADVFEVFTECNNPDTGLIEDFGKARQRSLELCTGDALFWVDGDDVVRGAEKLRELKTKSDNFVVIMPYEYSRDEHGNVTCLHYRERLVYPVKSFAWQCPVHEVLLPVEPVEGTRDTVMIDDVVIEHRQAKSTKVREPQRNLRILEAYVKRCGESDPRAMYYLGLEHQRVGNFGDAWRVWERYVQLSGWAEEKCLAMLGIAQCYQHLGHHEMAIDWALKAMLVKAWPEPYYVIGKSFYSLAKRGIDEDYNWRRCQFWLQRGLELEGGEKLLFTNPTESAQVHEYLNYALTAIGDIEGAIKSCEAGLARLPHSEDMQENLRQLKRGKALRELEELGLLEGKDFQIRSVPGSPSHQAAPHGTLAQSPPIPGRLDLVFFTGPAWEDWTPSTLELGGMGGSETMAWQLARRLQAMGHRVRMYGNCRPEQEGLFEGVSYQHWERFATAEECDVLVVSRMPDAVDAPIKARVRVLWVHDVTVGEGLTLERDARFDRIWTLSEWHRDTFCEAYPFTNPKKVKVTRNGIDLLRFDTRESRDSHRAVYSSSPDRGLLTAVEVWPEVRKRVPDATLHIFYGFENWEKVIASRGAPGEIENVHILRRLIEATEGVAYHGRVDQQELAKEMLRSGVWAYPTWFTETSCITAMEAQAAGLYAVTSPIAALNETIGKNASMVKGDWRSEKYKREFVAEVVSAMAEMDEKTDEGMRARIQRDARRFCLDELAEEWSEDFYILCTHMEMTVVPEFREVEVSARCE